MLTFRAAKAALLSRSAARVGAIAMLMVLNGASARADQFLIVGGCTNGRISINCVARYGDAGDPYVRQVPQPDTEADKRRSNERDHKWIDRCRPAIVQDNLGVPRYHYAARGCEFGIIE